jgi:hypothetical protein
MNKNNETLNLSVKNPCLKVKIPSILGFIRVTSISVQNQQLDPIELIHRAASLRYRYKRASSLKYGES